MTGETVGSPGATLDYTANLSGSVGLKTVAYLDAIGSEFRKIPP